MSLEEKITTIQNILSSFNNNDNIDVLDKIVKVKGSASKCK